MKKLFQNNSFYCPICNDYFPVSDYLKSVIKDRKTLWIANMIMHYRHNHISSWNKCWNGNGVAYRSGWFSNYDNEKRKVNERAKRQIVRKCAGYMISKNITGKHFAKLLHNDKETIKLVKLMLDKRNEQYLLL